MLKNLKISKKLQIGFLISIVITCIVGCVGIVGMYQINSADQSLYDQQTEPLQYITKMIESVQAMRLDEREAIINAGNSSKITQLEKEINEYDSTFKNSETTYLSTLKIEEGINLVNGAKEQYENDFLPSVENTLKYASQGDTAQAQAAMNGGNDTAAQIVSTYDQIFKNANRDALSKSTNNNNLFVTLTIVLIVAIIVGVVASILLCVTIVRSISRPLNEMVSASEQFAQGNLKVNIAYQSKNEFGRLADSLRSVFAALQNIINEISATLIKMSNKDLSMDELKDYIGDFAPISQSMNAILNDYNNFFGMIQKSAEQVGNSSEQVSSSAQTLAQGATEQAGTIEELSSSTTDVSQKVKDNTNSILQVVEHIDVASKNVSHINSQMQKMLSAMEEIKTSSNEISNIIKVINDIAFQTNILSLNAAVEAARAGSAGKGFSVVAEEVRNLASKSADAAKQTKHFIENSIQKVTDGSQIADNTAKELNQTTVQIQNVEEAVQKIKQASTAQSSAVKQISQGIEQVSVVVQSNSATAEESAATSEELSAQADLLKNALAEFSLRKAV